MTKPVAIFSALMLALAAALFAYAPRPAELNGRPRVAATVFPLYDIVRSVAGDDVDVSLVLPPGAEPHSFEPTPSAVRALGQAKAAYAIGHGLDGWIAGMGATAGTHVVTVDRGIAIRRAAQAVALGGAAEEEEGPTDPHYWLDARNAARIAETVAADLAYRFPEHAAGFQARLDAYRTALLALDAEVRAALAPKRGQGIVTFHGAWYYFADAYGLKVAGTFEPAPGREPTPQGLAALRAAVLQSGTRTLYAEPLFSDAAVSAFARDEGLDIAQIDDIGGAPGRDSYISLLRYDAQVIAQSR